jgi:hypothetical protein
MWSLDCLSSLEQMDCLLGDTEPLATADGSKLSAKLLQPIQILQICISHKLGLAHLIQSLHRSSLTMLYKYNCLANRFDLYSYQIKLNKQAYSHLSQEKLSVRSSEIFEFGFLPVLHKGI